MKERIKKIIEKALSQYRKKEISEGLLSGYTLYIFKERERRGKYDGFLYLYNPEKASLKDVLSDKFKRIKTGYTPRIALILTEDELIVKDYRTDRKIKKTLKKVNKTFLKKIEKALSEPEEENFNKLFDRTDIIEEFYILYKKSRKYLQDCITGISDGDRRDEFVDNLMMQMLTLWYLQERGFFNKDTSYFITKFMEIKQKKLDGGFRSYYDFLKYFSDKVSNNIGASLYKDEALGEVAVLGPAVFLNGEVEPDGAITIPDRCFYKEGFTDRLITTPPKKVDPEVPLLNLFESRDWVEGDIDEFVLGALYEKLMTEDLRKRTGSYYTPEEITRYICKNTIEPYLLDRVNEESGRSWGSIDEVIEKGDREALLTLFKELKEIKILDPAVGSAHFLESAINLLLGIYEKVWERAREIGLKTGLEILAANEKGYIEPIDLLKIPDSEDGREQLKLYVKFFIILSKNVYGVDINPNAIKVAKARLFLTIARHFDAKRGHFIRFPNLHFNLRCGNSLIGYLDLREGGGKGGKEGGRDEGKGSQLSLDLFVKEDEAGYIADHITVVSGIESYLRKVSEALGIEGDIVSEVKELNRILSKRRITWSEFERVLRTKEKLITILIASLNLEHAKPLNELLNRITELFNEKLDERFAEEHNIELEDLKQIKTFHWVFEFPEGFLDRGGFDVVVGNPPYGDSLVELEKSVLFYDYITSNLNEISANFFERELNLMIPGGTLGNVTTVRWLYDHRFKPLHDLLLSSMEYSRITCFERRPSQIFKDAQVQVTIVSGKKCQKEECVGLVETSRFIRFSHEERSQILTFSNIEYESIDGLILRESIGGDIYKRYQILPKVGSKIARSILEKLRDNSSGVVGDFVKEGGNHVIYRQRGGGYRPIAVMEAIYQSTGFAPLYFSEKIYRDLSFLIVNSHLFYFFWMVYSNARNLDIGLIKRFPVPPSKKIKEFESYISGLADRVWEDMINAFDRKNNYFRMSKIRKSLIEIDILLSELYGLTKKELEYIIHYDEKYIWE